MKQFFTFLFVVLVGVAGYTALGHYDYHDYWMPVELDEKKDDGSKQVEVNIDLDNLSEQTDKLLEAGKVKQTVSKLNKKLKELTADQREKHGPKIYFLLGQGYAKLGQNKKARTNFQKYLDTKPETDRKADVLYRIGKTYTDDLDQRASYFRRAAELQPYGEVAKKVAEDYETALGSDPGPVKQLLHLSLRFRFLTESGSDDRKKLYKKLKSASDEVFRAGETYLNAKEYSVQSGDALSNIAARNHVGMGWINYTNHRSLPVTGPHHDDIAQRLRPGDRLVIFPGRISIDVYISDFRLSLFYEDLYFINSYPVGVGEGGKNKTPTGSFKVTEKTSNPVWYHPETGEKLAPDDPKNILGTRWIGINLSGYGIHGVESDMNDTIGTKSSMGCIRMKNINCETVYDMIPNGIPSLPDKFVPKVRILE